MFLAVTPCLPSAYVGTLVGRVFACWSHLRVTSHSFGDSIGHDGFRLTRTCTQGLGVTYGNPVAEYIAHRRSRPPLPDDFGLTTEKLRRVEAMLRRVNRLLPI